MPEDLTPLPTAPYDERPTSLPLVVEECRTALWMAEGNVTRAARILKTPPARLRKFIRGSERLQAECEEAREQLVDQAEAVISEALSSGEPARSDSMAKYVASNLGKNRGYSTRAETTGPDGKDLFGGVETEARAFMDKIAAIASKSEAAHVE